MGGAKSRPSGSGGKQRAVYEEYQGSSEEEDSEEDDEEEYEDEYDSEEYEEEEMFMIPSESLWKKYAKVEPSCTPKTVFFFLFFSLFLSLSYSFSYF